MSKAGPQERLFAMRRDHSGVPLPTWARILEPPTSTPSTSAICTSSEFAVVAQHVIQTLLKCECRLPAARAQCADIHDLTREVGTAPFDLLDGWTLVSRRLQEMIQDALHFDLPAGCNIIDRIGGSTFRKRDKCIRDVADVDEIAGRHKRSHANRVRCSAQHICNLARTPTNEVALFLTGPRHIENARYDGGHAGCGTEYSDNVLTGALGDGIEVDWTRSSAFTQRRAARPEITIH